MNVTRYLLYLTTLLCFLPISVSAQFTGSLSNYTAYTASENPELIAGRNTLRLNFLQNTDAGRVYASGDLRHHFIHGTDSLQFRLREAYFELFFDNADLKIGKQIISWGKTQGDFIFDIISPFDLSEFITRDFTELREGVTAVSYTHYFGRNQLEFILNPVFTPSTLPDFDGRWGIIPTHIFPLETEYITYRNNSPNLKDVQTAMRFSYRPSLSLDLDAALMYWSFNNPGYFKTFETVDFFNLRIPESIILEETYKPGLITGFWGEYRASSKVSIPYEAAFFQKRPVDILPTELSVDDLNTLQNAADNNNRADLDELIDILTRFNTVIDRDADTRFSRYEPAIKFMSGFSTTFWGWSTTLQYSGEYILNYALDILQDEYFHSVTGIFRNSFLRDNLLFQLLGRYNINGGDFWVNPELQYVLRDGLSFRLGAHIFGGKTPASDYANLSFQRYRNNSLVFLQSRWSW